MPSLILGPMIRYVGTTEATVWVETDARCEVEILEHRASTFQVAGRHYALVAIGGLEPGSSTEYEVRLDGARCWPPAVSDFPPSRIQTLPETGPVTIAFGSCRVTAPQEPPYSLDPEQHELGLSLDALHEAALRWRDQDPEAWPRLLLMIGDQVYADEVSPQTRALIRARREVSAEPGEEVLDLEEYTWLYREAWSPPGIRWLLSTVPTAMIFDDHDVHDDWNISRSWIEDMQSRPWWTERIVGALVSYWIYQHLGNLSPDELEQDSLYQRVRAADDAAPLLREFALEADREDGGSRWSFSRRIANSRLLVLDSREGRVLRERHRQMLDEREWRWAEKQLEGAFDHVLVVSTLPVLLPPSVHYVEAWNEAVCDGAWGKFAARAGEKLRRALDLEHWSAFQKSFHRLVDLIGELAAGRYGAAPASIVLLGGDIHQAYVEEVAFRTGAGTRSRVYQAVCSPFRHPLSRRDRTAFTIARRSRALAWLTRRAARAAGVRDPEIRWRPLQEPTFENQIGWVQLDGRHLWLTLERVRPGDDPALEVSFHRQLA
jgi:hypothetical protein